MVSDEELYDVLSGYKDAIDALNKRLDAYDTLFDSQKERLDGLEGTLFNELINPAKEALDEFNYNGELNDFSDKYEENFEPYVKQSKIIKGKDFDLYKDTFDKVKADPDNEDAIVSGALQEIKDQIAEIKAAAEAGDFNDPAEAVEAVEEVIEEAVAEEEVEEPVAEEPVEEVVEEEIVEEIPEDEEDSIDVDPEEFQRELDEYLEK